MAATGGGSGDLIRDKLILVLKDYPADMKPLTLRHNFSWTFIGNAVYAACQWGMLVALAKLGNSEMVGQFTLGLAITAPIIMFSNLQLRNLQATDATAQYNFGDYLSLRIISTFLALVIIGAIAIFSGYSWTTSAVIYSVGISKSIEAISDVYYGLLQQNERMDKIAISLMIKGPLSLFLLSAGIYFTKNILWGVAGLIVAWIIVLVIVDIQNGSLILRYLKKIHKNNVDITKKELYSPYPSWHPKKIINLALLAFPMGFVMLLISLNTNIPRYFLEQNLGVEKLGIFAAIAYLMMVGKTVISALAESADARLAAYYASGELSAFYGLIIRLLSIGFLLGATGILVAIFVGREILTLLYRPEYGEYNNILILVMVSALIDYLFAFLGHGMTAARYFRIQVPLLATVSITAALSSLLLIPLWGMQGAAFSLMISTGVGTLGSLGVLIHAYSKRLSTVQS
jgi:O-antigen/teichoic acid export membrane protein